ncbi:MAG TPA: cytochrome P450 [Thermoleophilaceae bacterium]
MSTLAAALPPGPTQPSPLLAARFMLQPTRFLEANASRYGDAFTVQLSKDRTVVITSDPDTVKRVFTGDPEQLLAGVGNVVLKPLLGPRSVLLLDGPEHLRQRRLMLPSFHGERMRTYGEAMRDAAERHVNRWPIGSSFPTQPSMQAITLEVILRAVFGVRDDREVERLATPLRRMLDATASQARLVLLQLTKSEGASPRSPWGRFRALMAPADAVVSEQIQARRDDPQAAERDDVLSLLLAARDEDGQPLTDAELRDELMTLLLAGHETTATALSWTLERIVRHPEVLERLVAEQRDGGDEYLDAVIKETLRLRPVVPGVVRYLTAPFQVKEWELPAGVNVAPSIYLLHRRADLYPNPLAFQPERFLDAKPGTYEWIPFGGGVRRCLGASFALYEMKIVLSTILARAKLQPVQSRDERTTRRAITYTPARGGRIQVESLVPARPAARAQVAA